MSIEFACENCARLLRVPDGSSGKKSQCPACLRFQEIPYVITSRDPVQHGSSAPAGSVADSVSETGGGAVHSTASGNLSIPCPSCRHHLVCSPELLGTRGQCRKCQHIFTITTTPENTSQDKTPGLVFSCPKCQQLFEGRAEMAGRSGRCHVCQAVFAIELRPAAKAPIQALTAPAAPSSSVAPSASSTASGPGSAVSAGSNPGARGSVPKTEPRRPAAPSKPKKPIQFTCRQCQGLMEVPGSSAGLDTACPYCQTIQRIPARSKSPAAPSIRNAAADYANPPPARGTSQANEAYTSLGSALDPFAATNPYAVAPQSVWQAPARSRTELTFGNVFAVAFENMFPSCLFTVVHTVVATCAGLLLLGFVLGMLYLFAGLKLGPQAAIGATIVLFMLIAPVGVAMGAWFSSSIRNMALLAVRGRTFDGSQALSPGGAYNVGLLIAFINMILQLVTRAPQLIEQLAPGRKSVV